MNDNIKSLLSIVILIMTVVVFFYVKDFVLINLQKTC